MRWEASCLPLYRLFTAHVTGVHLGSLVLCSLRRSCTAAKAYGCTDTALRGLLIYVQLESLPEWE